MRKARGSSTTGGAALPVGAARGGLDQQRAQRIRGAQATGGDLRAEERRLGLLDLRQGEERQADSERAQVEIVPRAAAREAALARLLLALRRGEQRLDAAQRGLVALRRRRSLLVELLPLPRGQLAIRGVPIERPLVHAVHVVQGCHTRSVG